VLGSRRGSEADADTLGRYVERKILSTYDPKIGEKCRRMVHRYEGSDMFSSICSQSSVGS
jgi:hypothetical protein